MSRAARPESKKSPPRRSPVPVPPSAEIVFARTSRGIRIPDRPKAERDSSVGGLGPFSKRQPGFTQQVKGNDLADKNQKPRHIQNSRRRLRRPPLDVIIGHIDEQHRNR